jgi:hypothetical protein
VKPKFCVDCRHLMPALHRQSKKICAALTSYDLVTGKLLHRNAAAYMRSSIGECGPDAKHWEPKDGIEVTDLPAERIDVHV